MDPSSQCPRYYQTQHSAGGPHSRPLQPGLSPNRQGSASVHGVEGSAVEWAEQLGKPGCVILKVETPSQRGCS
ncbi:Uncharacterized protein DAT39_005472, partial [Clarias magur]